MSNYFLGQIMLAGFGFAPKGFSSCDGQLMPISQNQALFALLGVNYGGNGTQTFALPDLRGRTPVGFGPSADPAWQPPTYAIGEAAGSEAVTVLPGQMPAHTHLFNASTVAGTVKSPAGALYGGSGAESFYAAPAHPVPLAASTLAQSGGSAAHPNVQPSSVLGFSIALSGIYPSRN